MNACLENDHIMAKIEKKLEITFYQNKSKLNVKKFHQDGQLKQPISLIDLYSENL
jgi:hypothetical protein